MLACDFFFLESLLLKRSQDYVVVNQKKLKEDSLFSQSFRGCYDISLYSKRRFESELG